MTKENHWVCALLVEKKSPKKVMFVVSNARKSRKITKEKIENITEVWGFAPDVERTNCLGKKRNAQNAWLKCTN